MAPSAIVNETLGNRVSAFDIPPNGDLGPRRDWAQFGALPETDDVSALIGSLAIGPEGGALDAEGAVWVADAIGNPLVRAQRGGKILEQIDTGSQGVYAAALGGPKGTTLFMAVAPNFDEAKRKASLKGQILMTEVDVPHAGLP